MLIYILGVDGSGKTTLARSLHECDSERVEYVYCQHKPILLWLLKAPARVLFMRRTDQFKNYNAYRARKDAIVAKRRLAASIYKWAFYADVVLQTWPKLVAATARTRKVVIDRYYLDWVVNLSVMLNSDTNAMLRDAKLLERLLPKADIHVLLDLPEDVAFYRKDDIQSIAYLRERRVRYRALIDHYNFHVIDANRSPDLVRAHVDAIVARCQAAAQ